jgi:hypothetical protein
MENIKWLKDIPLEVGYYLTGFTDGEGSFNVSLRKKDYGVGWQISPVFNVSQRDRTVLAQFKRWLGCGTLRTRKDGVVYYEVSSLKSLNSRVIPFFKKFGFRSASKKTNFRIFREIVEMMTNESHLKTEGFEKILRLRETLNEGRGRKRKHNISDVFESQQ